MGFRFSVEQVQPQDVDDQELSNLLNEVYVDAGYCTPEEAKTIFAPQAVKSRGWLFAARETNSNTLAGIVIVVPHNSPASKLAKENQCEMHLLGVANSYRGLGLGKQLIDATIDFARKENHQKMILWTQKPMKRAQTLYDKSGFEHQSTFEKNNRDFLLYDKSL